MDERLCVSVECVVKNLIKYKLQRKRLSISVERGVRD